MSISAVPKRAFVSSTTRGRRSHQPTILPKSRGDGRPSLRTGVELVENRSAGRSSHSPLGRSLTSYVYSVERSFGSLWLRSALLSYARARFVQFTEIMHEFDLTKGISFTRMSDYTERTAMQFEHRRTARYAFGGAAEVTDIESGKCVVSVTSQLGLFGCFVKTMDRK